MEPRTRFGMAHSAPRCKSENTSSGVRPMSDNRSEAEIFNADKIAPAIKDAKQILNIADSILSI